MGPGAETDASEQPPEGRPPFVLRWGRLSDLAALVRLYRGQSPESRRFYHPYPFDRPRLIVVLLGLLLSSRWVRPMLRLAPNYAFVVVVAQESKAGPLVGLATTRFVRRGGDPVWGQYGYLVREEVRGRGLGAMLAIGQYRISLELGVHRGGGTILAGNVPSARVVERFGFRLEPTAQPDSRSLDRQNLGAVEDLDQVVERIRSNGGWPAVFLSETIAR